MVAYYPTLAGIAFGVTKTPSWNTNIQTAVTGHEVRIAQQARPRYQFTLVYEFLRDTAAANELATLLGFYNQRKGAFGTFVFVDPDDNTAGGQAIGVGDGSSRTWNAVRTAGGSVEVVGYITGMTGVYVDGAPAAYSYAGNSVTLNSAPANGAVVTADFTYGYVCRFKDDQLELSKFAAQLWEAKTVTLISLFEDPT
ncbi:DUF2460 domain-containing protein [Nitrospirillum amazonense]|uniref:DUF2460 domain-containing protein n=1 Tax=Nitrospirillum amazonense TaxID=28077 RepID=UPI0024122B3C|nr:DUF2460 domain-containing protein [Nitrospirillum amazonense]MDG3442475.1 DUF2460 domain-containing protein [Nitrospirillum amazonense]